jgi:phosphoribosyl 1,2-cyclic phosphodiesterase
MPGLFSRPVTVASLASGSSGNCTYVGDSHAGLLIDCGISARQVQRRWEELGGAPPVDAILLTHEHDDHVGAAGVIGRKLKVPFYLTRGTLRNMKPQCTPEATELVEPGQRFRVRHLELEAFTIPHDVADPVAWKVRVGDVSVAVVTDLGRPTALVARQIREVDVLVLEFNHDERLLMEGRYPWALKQRIRSNHGHLSNTQAAQLLTEGYTPRLKHLVLAHLSEENNSPALALREARRALEMLGAEHVQVHVATQGRATGPIQVTSNSWS